METTQVDQKGVGHPFAHIIFIICEIKHNITTDPIQLFFSLWRIITCSRWVITRSFFVVQEAT